MAGCQPQSGSTVCLAPTGVVRIWLLQKFNFPHLSTSCDRGSLPYLDTTHPPDLVQTLAQTTCMAEARSSKPDRAFAVLRDRLLF
jgi:hypothetical protein